MWKYQNGKGEKSINISHTQQDREKKRNLSTILLWISRIVCEHRSNQTETGRKKRVKIQHTERNHTKLNTAIHLDFVVCAVVDRTHIHRVLATPTDINSKHLINVSLESSWIQNIITFVYIMACDLFHMWVCLYRSTLTRREDERDSLQFLAWRWLRDMCLCIVYHTGRYATTRTSVAWHQFDSMGSHSHQWKSLAKRKRKTEPTHSRESKKNHNNNNNKRAKKRRTRKAEAHTHT